MLTNSSTFLLPSTALSGIPLGLTAPTDPDGDAVSITITAIPSQASISLAGANVAVGQILSTNQFISLSVAKFPGTQASTTNLRTFEFSVSDGKSTATPGSVSISTTATTQQTTPKTGDSGNNTLAGTTGNDSIDAGAGDDVILGSTGNDVLIGGLGTDLVVYSSSSSDVSFQKSADETISLSIG
ncbi:MAG: hypothetical protein FJY58_09625 [Betaproteobacteria bacterium]|nr:hypothetical protein [Betaproteobacteria bacterium]